MTKVEGKRERARSLGSSGRGRLIELGEMALALQRVGLEGGNEVKERVREAKVEGMRGRESSSHLELDKADFTLKSDRARAILRGNTIKINRGNNRKVLSIEKVGLGQRRGGREKPFTNRLNGDDEGKSEGRT